MNAEFEEGKARRDTHVKTKVSTSVYRNKQRASDLKTFKSQAPGVIKKKKLRTVLDNGMKVNASTPSQIKEAKEGRFKMANKMRNIQQSLENGQRLPKNSPFTVPRGPGLKVRAYDRKNRHHAAPARSDEIDFDHYVARFARSGELPSPEIGSQLIAANGKSGVKPKNQKQFKKLIQALLMRAGVEQNPGPRCKHTNAMVKAEKVVLRGQTLYFCPNCATQLVNVNEGLGYHPLAWDDFVPTPQTSYSSTSTTSVATASSLPLAVPPPIATAATTATTAPNVPNAPTPATVTAPTARSTVSTAAALVTTTVTTTTTIVTQSTTNPPLDGYRLKPAEVRRIMATVVPKDETYFNFQIEEATRIVPYTAENRLATQRGVSPIESSMVVIENRVKVYKPYNMFVPIIATLLLCTSFWLKMINLGRNLINTLRVLTHPFTHPALLSLMNPRFYQVPIILAIAILGIYIVYSWIFKEKEDFRRFTYVPHLVSSSLLEFDRKCPLEIAESTILQKFRRLASLPIADNCAVQLYDGSAVVVLNLISHRNSVFRARAVCMTGAIFQRLSKLPQ